MLIHFINILLKFLYLDDFKSDESTSESSNDIVHVLHLFENMQKDVLEVLCREAIDIQSFVKRLKSSYALNDCAVPAFDDDLFEEVNSVEALWKKFCIFWSHVFDCHVLEVFLEKSCCGEAKKVYQDFLLEIEKYSVINKLDLVAYYGIYKKMQNFSISFLTIEFKLERCFTYSIKAIYEAFNKIFNINKHALHLISIEKGIHVIFHISKSLANHLLERKDLFTGYTLCQLAEEQIATLQLMVVTPQLEKNVKLEVPKKINKVGHV